LQSSPQQVGTLPVVAFLMQRFAAQQPTLPQHTWQHKHSAYMRHADDKGTAAVPTAVTHAASHLASRAAL
jgi:hypothetical protein